MSFTIFLPTTLEVSCRSGCHGDGGDFKKGLSGMWGLTWGPDLKVDVLNLFNSLSKFVASV